LSIDINYQNHLNEVGHYTSLKLPNISKANEKVHLPSIFSPQNNQYEKQNESMFSDGNLGQQSHSNRRLGMRGVGNRVQYQ
jgi:hypothetical protein